MKNTILIIGLIVLSCSIYAMDESAKNTGTPIKTINELKQVLDKIEHLETDKDIQFYIAPDVFSEYMENNFSENIDDINKIKGYLQELEKNESYNKYTTLLVDTMRSQMELNYLYQCDDAESGAKQNAYTQYDLRSKQLKSKLKLLLASKKIEEAESIIQKLVEENKNLVKENRILGKSEVEESDKKVQVHIPKEENITHKSNPIAKWASRTIVLAGVVYLAHAWDLGHYININACPINVSALWAQMPTKSCSFLQKYLSLT